MAVVAAITAGEVTAGESFFSLQCRLPSILHLSCERHVKEPGVDRRQRTSDDNDRQRAGLGDRAQGDGKRTNGGSGTGHRRGCIAI